MYYLVHSKVRGNSAIFRLPRHAHSSNETQLFAGNVSVNKSKIVITDRLAIDHDIPLMRAPPPHQPDG